MGTDPSISLRPSLFRVLPGILLDEASPSMWVGNGNIWTEVHQFSAPLGEVGDRGVACLIILLGRSNRYSLREPRVSRHPGGHNFVLVLSKTMWSCSRFPMVFGGSFYTSKAFFPSLGSRGKLPKEDAMDASSEPRERKLPIHILKGLENAKSIPVCTARSTFIYSAICTWCPKKLQPFLRISSA